MCYNEIKFKDYGCKERRRLTFIKKIKSLRKSIKIAGGLVIAIILVVTVFSFYYRDKWYPHTLINGVDVSSMTYVESKEKLQKAVDNYSLAITGQGKQKFTVDGKDVDLTADFADNLKQYYEQQQKGLSILGIFGGEDHEIDLKITYNQDKLQKLVNNTVLITGSDEYQLVPSSNAHIEYDETTKSGKMIKATVGNELNIDKFNELIVSAMNSLTTQIDLTDQEKYGEVYQQPLANISDKQLETMLNTYNSYLLNWITWNMGENKTETLSPEEIKNWLSCNEQGEIVLDQQGLSDWIEEMCLKYKTVGKARDFTTHNGTVIKISGGDYGWRLDYDKIVEQVVATIREETDQKLIDAYLSDQSKKNKTALTTALEPTYSNKAYQKGAVDWDPLNYSEVDLTEQRVYVYRDGQLAYTCVCVTGLPTEKQDRITRTGAWYIKEKKPEKVLVGEDYETPVKYWIRIMWTGTGYHALNRSDWANWTPELYKVKGSHGCINLQENDAKSIYDLVRINDAVFIHQ